MVVDWYGGLIVRVKWIVGWGGGDVWYFVLKEYVIVGVFDLWVWYCYCIEKNVCVGMEWFVVEVVVCCDFDDVFEIYYCDLIVYVLDDVEVV